MANNPRPFRPKGERPDVLAILDELERMRTSHLNDARRHQTEATRIGELRVALQEEFRARLKRKKATA